MQKPRHPLAPGRFAGNNGPEGGGGSSYSQVRGCGGGNQGSAPQPPPQDKSLSIHQGSHLATQYSAGPSFARQPSVPNAQAQIFHHVQSQIRTAQTRSHQIPQGARPIMLPYQMESSIQSPPPMFSIYPSQPLVSMYPGGLVNAIPPPTESGSAQRSAVQLGAPAQFAWNRQSTVVMSQPPTFPPGYNYMYPPQPSTPNMAQPPHNPQQQTMLQQMGANMNQGMNSGMNSGMMLATGGNVANQANQSAKNKGKRSKAIKIINPVTFEEVKADEQDSNTDHSSTSLHQEGSGVIDGRTAAEFAHKVAMVASEDTPSRHEEIEPQPASAPQPVINGPSEVEAGKRTGSTPVVSALTSSTPAFEFPQKRNSSRPIVEGRGSGSPGRSKATTIPQTNVVKSSQVQPAPSQSPAVPSSQMVILQQQQQQQPLQPQPLQPQPLQQQPLQQQPPPPQQQQQPAAIPPLQTTQQMMMPPPLVKPPSQVAQPVLQPVINEEHQQQQIQQSEHHPPPKQQRKPREEKKTPPVVVQVEEKVQPAPSPPPPAPPSIEEPVITTQVVLPSSPSPPPITVTPTPVVAPAPQPPAQPTPSVAQTNSKISAFASNFHINLLTESAKAAHSAVAASIPTAEEKQQPAETPQEQQTVKAAQRIKTKKNQKLREINQKGLEKEGTDMDSMVDCIRGGDATPNRESSPVGKPTPPEVDVQPAEVQPPSLIPPLMDSIKKLEEDDDKETIDMVTAKNEENTLLSMQNSTEEVIESQVIVRSSSPPLKFDYKEDQWSPKNPSGKKVYDRDFLLKLRTEPLSSKKPDNMQYDLEIFLKDKDSSVNNNNNNNNNNTNALRNTRFVGSYSMSGARGNGFIPDFVRSSSSQTRTVSKRSSQQNRPSNISSGRGSKGMYNSLSLRDDFKLNQVENAWKPVKFVKHAEIKSKDEHETEDLYRRVRGILNKLTPQKFDVLVGQFKRLPINNIDRLTGVIRLVFEKAVDEPAFSVAYAELCKFLAKLEVKTESAQGEDGSTTQSLVNFRKLLITRCQTEFEANKKAELDFEKKLTEINETKDPEKKKELQQIYNEEERKIRMKSVGLVRFIGELYKLKMLTANIMHGCIRQLLEKIDEESLECLCKLLTTIGKELETTSNSSADKGAEWNEYFSRMSKLSRKNEHGNKISSRVRFMLQDVIELRENKWVPRRDENKPKTMAQIQEEVEKESEKAALMATAGRKFPDDRRNEPRRNNQRGSNQTEDGWTAVKSSSYRSNYSPEASKIQDLKNNAAIDMGNSNITPSLGSSRVFSHWVRGATTKQSSFTDSNTFAVLNNTDERKPPTNNMRSMKPSPSIERERAMAGVKEVFPVSDRSSDRSSRDNRGRSVSQQSPSPSLSGPAIGASQPQSLAPKKTEPTSKPEPLMKPPPSPPAPIDPDKLLQKTNELLVEFTYNSNIKESIESVKELIDGSDGKVFISCAINRILEMRSTASRIKSSELLGELLKNDVFTVDSFLEEMKFVFESGDDLKIDMPYVWQYIGEIFGTIMAKEALGFEHLKIASSPVSTCSSLESSVDEIFKILLVDKVPAWIKEQWDASKVQLSDFLLEDKIKPFLEKHPFLEGHKVNVNDSNLPLDKVEEKLISFLKVNKDNAVDHVLDWLTANVGKRTNDPSFIRTLTKAVIKASLDLEDSHKLDKDLLHRNMILMKRYVDNNEELELTCLYTVQNLVVITLESPSGMLVDIFKELNESSVISHEGFLKWRYPGREENAWEFSGKGVATATLKTFFKALEDDAADEDDDAS